MFMAPPFGVRNPDNQSAAGLLVGTSGWWIGRRRGRNASPPIRRATFSSRAISTAWRSLLIRFCSRPEAPTSSWPSAIPLGDLLWVRRAGGSGFYSGSGFTADVALGVAVDSEGNAYITGSFTGTASFETVSLVRSSAWPYSSQNTIGTVISCGPPKAAYRQYPGQCDLRGAYDRVFLTGLFAGTNSLGTNGLSLTNSNLTNSFFVAWLRTQLAGPNGPKKAIGEFAARDGRSRRHPMAWCMSAVISPAASISMGGVGGNRRQRNGDLWLAAWEPDGTLLWASTAGGAYADTAAGIAVDLSGDVFVTGCFKSIARFGETSVSAGSNPEIFLAKYSRQGRVWWVRSAGGTGPDYGRAVAVDVGGNVMVAGSFFRRGELSRTSDSGRRRGRCLHCRLHSGWRCSFRAPRWADGQRLRQCRLPGSIRNVLLSGSSVGACRI